MEEMNFGLPTMSVIEEGDEVLVRVKISGISEKDIELEVHEDSLKVDISRKFEKKKRNKDFFEKEWESSSFSGEVSLPCKVIPMLPRHSYDGRVLEVRLRKSEDCV